ncbi:hypothetical protein EK904_008679 [Melospiza melodia maxima]|nr:hypothetical protein EK904_008679 [Melospiza melodia maxima]
MGSGMGLGLKVFYFGLLLSQTFIFSNDCLEFEKSQIAKYLGKMQPNWTSFENFAFLSQTLLFFPQSEMEFEIKSCAQGKLSNSNINQCKASFGKHWEMQEQFISGTASSRIAIPAHSICHCCNMALIDFEIKLHILLPVGWEQIHQPAEQCLVSWPNQEEKGLGKTSEKRINLCSALLQLTQFPVTAAAQIRILCDGCPCNIWCGRKDLTRIKKKQKNPKTTKPNPLKLVTFPVRGPYLLHVCPWGSALELFLEVLAPPLRLQQLLLELQELFPGHRGTALLLGALAMHPPGLEHLQNSKIKTSAPAPSAPEHLRNLKSQNQHQEHLQKNLAAPKNKKRKLSSSVTDQTEEVLNFMSFFLDLTEMWMATWFLEHKLEKKTRLEGHEQLLKMMEERMMDVEQKLRLVKRLLQDKVNQLKEQLSKNTKADAMVKDLYVENAQLLKALEVTEQRQKTAERKNYLLEEKIANLNRIVKNLASPSFSPEIRLTYFDALAFIAIQILNYLYWII